MTDPRLSTVFDYSNLRLHPDGTRVYQKTSNLRPGLVKVTTQDPRSNWIARDAGGFGTVRKARKRVRDVSEELEDNIGAEKEGDAESNQELSDNLEECEKDDRKRKRKRLNQGKLKRQKFANNDSYLQPEASSSKNNDTDVRPEIFMSEQGFPEPSADLLKCIHRFASEFYTERGQLLNISREYRRERKERALRRRDRREKQLGGTKDGEDSDSNPGSEYSESDGNSSSKSTGRNTDDEKNSDEEEESSDSEDSNNEAKDDDKSSKKNMKGKTKAKPKRRRRRGHYADKLYTDMYKMFDGSAIMALGMLVQEQIAQMVNPQMPDAWKQEMEAVYGHVSVEEDLQGIESSTKQIVLAGETHAIKTRTSPDKTLTTKEGTFDDKEAAVEATPYTGEEGIGEIGSEALEIVRIAINPPDISGSQNGRATDIRESFDLAGDGAGNPKNKPAFRAPSRSGSNLSTAGLKPGPEAIDENGMDDLIQSSSEESLRSEDTENSDSQGEID